MRRTTGIILLGLAMVAANARAQGVVPPPKPAESSSDAVDDVVRAEMRKRHDPRPLARHHPGRQDRQGEEATA